MNLAEAIQSLKTARCEVCGGKATTLVLDVREAGLVRDEEGDWVRTWEPESRHAFCEAHRRPSRKLPPALPAQEV